MEGLPSRYNLMLNGFIGTNMREEMATEAGVAKFLKYTADVADMKLITQLTVDIEDATDGVWFGLSGLAMIATSHIAIHLWPSLKSYFMFDISSCKPFDIRKITFDIQSYLEASIDFEAHKEYTPTHIILEKDIVRRFPTR